MPHDKTDLPRWQDRLMIACCSAVAAGALATRRQHWVVIDYTCNTCSSVESRSRGHWQPSDDGRKTECNSNADQPQTQPTCYPPNHRPSSQLTRHITGSTSIIHHAARRLTVEHCKHTTVNGFVVSLKILHIHVWHSRGMLYKDNILSSSVSVQTMLSTNMLRICTRRRPLPEARSMFSEFFSNFLIRSFNVLFFRGFSRHSPNIADLF